MEQSSSHSSPLLWLVPGWTAGVAVGIVDAVSAWGAGADLRTTVALLALCAVAGSAIAFVGWLAHRVIELLYRAAPRLPRGVTAGALVAVAAVPVARAMFSGAGISRSAMSAIGTWGFPFVAGLLGALVWMSMRRAFEARDVPRRLTALGCATAALVLFAVDRRVLVGLYLYAHVLAALGGVGALALAAALWRRPRATDGTLGAFAALVSALSLAAMTTTFPHDNAASALLVRQRPLGAHVIRAVTYLVDIDRDGASTLFGGNDCDDFDVAIGPHRHDIPGNRIDEDCDGFDALEIVARRPYGGSRKTAEAFARAAAGRPTVVILVDALRADRVGDPRFTHLARLHAESVRFERAFAPASSTALSVHAMLTGKLLPHSGDPTLFARLASAGRTSAVVATETVFQTVEQVSSATNAPGFPIRRDPSRIVVVAPPEPGPDTHTDRAVTNAAFEVLDAGAPALLWVHYYDLHEWRGGADADANTAQYDAATARVDAEIARWLERSHGVNLILVADHGEGLGSHDTMTHAMYLWRDLVHVPLVVRIPGVEPRSVPMPVNLQDLTPTVLDLMGLGAPQDWPWSLIALPGVGGVQSHFAMFETFHASLVAGRYRVVYDFVAQARWLYDLQADPTEQHDLAASHPGLADAMAREARSHAVYAAARFQQASR